MLISSKVALSISVAVALIGATATVVAVDRQKTERRAEFTGKSLEAVELLALTVATPVAEHRHAEVQDALDNIANFPDRFHDVRSLEVIGEDGRLIASLDPTRFNELASDADADLKQPEASTLFEAHTLRVVAPLVLSHRLGVLRASFDTGSLDRSVQRQQSNAALLVVVTIALLGVSLHLLHRRLVAARLERLARAADTLGQGSMQVRADADGDDEIAGLGRSFNTMADALKRYTDNLEGIITERTAELEAANARLAALATTDPMTGLRNRRHFDEFARQAFEVAARNARPLSLVMVDTDRFKSINDRFGHPAGDEILKDVARVMLATARKSDLCARIGGEEFVVLMPETGGPEAVVAAERNPGCPRGIGPPHGPRARSGAHHGELRGRDPRGCDAGRRGSRRSRRRRALRREVGRPQPGRPGGAGRVAPADPGGERVSLSRRTFLGALSALVLSGCRESVATKEAEVNPLSGLAQHPPLTSLRVGITPIMGARTAAAIAPLVRFLERELSVPVDATIATHYDALAELVTAGSIDLGISRPALTSRRATPCPRCRSPRPPARVRPPTWVTSSCARTAAPWISRACAGSPSPGSIPRAARATCTRALCCARGATIRTLSSPAAS